MDQSNIIKIIDKKWHVFVFIILLFLSTYFLISDGGVWAFTDSGFYYRTAGQSFEMLLSKLGLFTRTDGFYFGFDNSAVAFSHVFISAYQTVLTAIFGATFGQIIFYWVYYFITFFFGLKVFRLLCGKYGDFSIRIGALFLAFNPFSILVSTLFVVGYIYPLFIVWLYFISMYLLKGRAINLFFSVFFGLYLVSYIRLVPIVLLTFAAVVWIFYDRKYFHGWRIALFGICFGLAALPFLIGITSSLSGSSSVVSNYIKGFSEYEQVNYSFKQSFVNAWSHPGGFTPFALSYYQNPRVLTLSEGSSVSINQINLYKTIQAIFNIGLLLAALLLVRSKRSVRLSALILAAVLINAIAFFISPSQFVWIHSTILVFLYNDFGFIQFTQSILTSFLVVIVVAWAHQYARMKIAPFAVILFTIAYLIVTILPFLSSHYAMQKVVNQNSNHIAVLGQREPAQPLEPTMFVPYHWAKFSWAPYFLDVHNAYNTAYSSMLIPNLRFISSDTAQFYNQIHERVGDPNFSNLRLLNLKNIIIFKDIEDANDNVDTYEVFNQESTVARILQQISTRNDVSEISSNEDIEHWQFSDAPDYEFFIYSPQEVLPAEFEDFYKEKLNIANKPILLSKVNFPAAFENNLLEYQLNSPRVEYKASARNPNKYYIKVQSMKDYPFLIQFNQSYSPHWKLYFTDKNTWESILCKTELISYEITDNAMCQYKGISISPSDAFLLNKPYLRPEHHGKGNLIANTFLITPNDIPLENRNDDAVYLVLYFQGQLYYQLTLILSAITLGVLAIIALADIFIGRNKSHEEI